MNTITVNNEKCIFVKDLFAVAPIYTQGSKSSRKLMVEKNISKDDFYHVRCVDGEYYLTDGKSNKHDILCVKLSIVENVPEVAKKLKSARKTKNVDCTNKKWVTKRNIQLNDEADDGEKKDVKPVLINHIDAKIITLEDNQKFRDCDGNIIDIETRGDREFDKIYFKLSDIAESFGVKNIENTILDAKSHYEPVIDFVYITLEKKKKAQKKDVALFLTYEGVLKIFIVLKNSKMRPYVRWAIETLFVCQMGTEKQKEVIVRNLLGVSASTFRELMSPSQVPITCVYLFTLGYVADLRISMSIDANIPDDFIVAKYGYSKDLARRTGEHLPDLEKIKNVSLRLKYYSYIDPQFTSAGETYIKNLFNASDSHIRYEKKDEIVAISKKQLESLAESYDHIGKKYSGNVSELITKIKDLECNIELANTKHEKELLEKDNLLLVKDNLLLAKEKELQNERNEKELIKEKMASELLKKDVDFLKFQLEMKKK